MKISLVTPAGKQSRAGNRTTAARWARILRSLGHQVRVSTEHRGDSADMLIAIHAWRSADSIARFADAHPDRPLVVALSGTDIYRFQHSHPEETLRSKEQATALVCLHDLVRKDIPDRFASKLNVIYQAAEPLSKERKPSKRFDVCVVGHLREEKDPLRAAFAARLVPPESRLRVTHFGGANDASWARKAREEMRRNGRYVWRGEVAGWQVRRAFSRMHLMVISSVMEGGANVVSESVVAEVPVIASDIAGNVGLLGSDYAGFYPAEDTAALADLLRRAETDPAFMRTLSAQCRKRSVLFRPERERRDWQRLLTKLEHRGVKGPA